MNKPELAIASAKRVESPGRIRVDAVDSLRGLAACTVAFIVHLANFGSPDPAPWFLQIEPFKWLHKFGALGVDLFFVLSGFIFALIYVKPIASGAVSAYDFFILRFSRLYPLHLGTLLLAAFVMWFTFFTLPFSMIPNNADPYHFFLNLGFIHYLGFQGGFSFNTPAWSLSLEGLCYAIFFVLALLSARFFAVGCVVMVLFGISMHKLALTLPLFNFQVGQATTAFFSGCLVALIFQSPNVRWLRWAALAVLGYFAFYAYVVGTIFGAVSPNMYLVFDMIIFPCVLLCALTFSVFRWPLELRRCASSGRFHTRSICCTTQFSLSFTIFPGGSEYRSR